MLSWDLYFTPDKASLIDRDFDKEHGQIALKLPFLNKTYDIEAEFDAILQHFSLIFLDEEHSVVASGQGTAGEGELVVEGPREEAGNEELPYDEATSTEMLVRKWSACPEPGRVYFYHRWDNLTADEALETDDNNQGPFVRVHLHRVKCKAGTLVRTMQETRRMALPRNFRRIYFGSSRGKGRRKARLGGNNLAGNKL